MSIGREEIERGLRGLGLKPGDLVLLHSSLASLGRVRGGARALVRAFLNVLGPRGTLMVPLFAGGAVPRAVADLPGAVCSKAPTATVAAVGGKASSLCADHWKAETAHGPGTPYLRLAEAGGSVCLLGVDQDRNTLLHAAEEMLRLPYLLKKTPPQPVATEEGDRLCSFRYFPGPHRDFIGLDRRLRSAGIVRSGRIGSAEVRLMKAREMLEEALAAGRENPAFVLCDNPACGDCRLQRADLRRDRLRREPFVLAASSQLAGRYVPEIIDQCRGAGVDAVELDGLQGTPVHRLDPAVLAAAVRDLRRAKIRVVGLRGRTLTEQPDELIRRAAACRVPRVVLPLTHAAAMQARLAAGKKIAVSFFNNVLGSEAVSGELLKLRRARLAAGFTFNAAHFAACGEQPFLGSYKRKLRRFVDQLDLEDALYDGTSRALFHGQAEIKEMVSILRCAGFRGVMLLGVRNAATGGLSEATDAFFKMLESL